MRIVPRLSVADGVSAVSTLLPTMWVEQAKCADGTQARHCHRIDVSPDPGQFSRKPVHNLCVRWVGRVEVCGRSDTGRATGACCDASAATWAPVRSRPVVRGWLDMQPGFGLGNVLATWRSAADTWHPLATTPINATPPFAGLSADAEARHIDETIKADTVVQTSCCLVRSFLRLI